MKIHEYQGKEIFRRFGMPVPRSTAVFSVEEAVDAARNLGGPVWVVKAQIHAGGRARLAGSRLRAQSKSPRARPETLACSWSHTNGPVGQKVRAC